MKNPRISVREAVDRATACGIPCRRTKRDAHWLFYIGNGQIVSVADGRREEVPPRLAKAIRERESGTVGCGHG